MPHVTLWYPTSVYILLNCATPEAFVSLFPSAPDTQPNSCPQIPFEGGDVLFVPEWNYSITAAYDRIFRGGELHASTTWRAQDDFNIAGSPPNNFIVEDGYGLLDARVSYQWNLANEDFLRVSASQVLQSARPPLPGRRAQ